MSEFKEFCEIIWNSSFFWGWLCGWWFGATLFYFSSRRAKAATVRTFDSDKYRWLLGVIAHAFGVTVEQVDEKIAATMAKEVT